MKYRFRATVVDSRSPARSVAPPCDQCSPSASPQGVFWHSFAKLPAEQQRRAREAFVIFKQNPFNPRLGSRYRRTIYAAEIETLIASRAKRNWSQSVPAG